MPTAGSARPKSPSHGRASESSPAARRARLSGPSGRVDHPPDHGDDDHRDDLRQEEQRPEARLAAHARARERADEHERERDRDHRVEEDQDERVLERRAKLAVVEDLAVVVEADPRRRRQPVPLVQREPDGVPERREHEGGVDGERRQEVEVADAPRRARRLDARPRAAAARRPPQPSGAETGSVPCSARRLSSSGTSRSRTGPSSANDDGAVLARHQLLDRGRDRVVHRRRRPVEVRNDRVLRVRLRPRVVDLGVEAGRHAHLALVAVSWPLLATTCIDGVAREEVEVRRRRVGVLRLRADRPRQPLAAERRERLALRRGSRKKPTFLPSAFFRSAVSQLPLIRKTPVALAERLPRAS